MTSYNDHNWQSITPDPPWIWALFERPNWNLSAVAQIQVGGQHESTQTAQTNSKRLGDGQSAPRLCLFFRKFEDFVEDTQFPLGKGAWAASARRLWRLVRPLFRICPDPDSESGKILNRNLLRFWIGIWADSDPKPPQILNPNLLVFRTRI